MDSIIYVCLARHAVGFRVMDVAVVILNIGAFGAAQHVGQTLRRNKHEARKSFNHGY
jgi:hypothetical protein